MMFYGHIKRKKSGEVWGEESERADSESMKRQEGQPY